MPAFQKGNRLSVGNKGGGAKSTFKPEYIAQAKKLALLGLTDKELGAFFEVTEMCINKWKHAFPEFRLVLKEGKAIADARVTQSLYRRALGYKHKAVRHFNDKGLILEAEYIEHYPPDTKACMYWLNNRQAARWRDRPDPETEDGMEIPESVKVTTVDASMPDDS